MGKGQKPLQEQSGRGLGLLQRNLWTCVRLSEAGCKPSRAGMEIFILARLIIKSDFPARPSGGLELGCVPLQICALFESWLY